MATFVKRASKPTYDFNVILIMQDNQNAKEIKKVFCFRKTLDISLQNPSKDELQKKLGNLHNKQCVVFYLEEKEHDRLKAIKINF